MATIVFTEGDIVSLRPFIVREKSSYRSCFNAVDSDGKTWYLEREDDEMIMQRVGRVDAEELAPAVGVEPGGDA